MSLKIIVEGDVVSIGLADARNSLDGFIDIYPSDEFHPSIFETIDDCKIFAEIMVKLLERVHDFKRQND